MLRRVDNISSRATVCEACGVRVSLSQENKDILGGFAYICPACNFIVAISYKGQKFRPSTVLSVSWNESLKESALRVTRNLYFAECKDQKALLALSLMQLYAKREQSGFLYLREAHKSALLLQHREQQDGGVKTESLAESRSATMEFFENKENNKKNSKGLLGKGTQMPSPSPDPFSC